MSIVAKITLSERLAKVIRDLDLKVNLTSDQLFDLHRYSELRVENEDPAQPYQVLHPPEAFEALFDKYCQSLYVLQHGVIFQEYLIDDVKRHLANRSNRATHTIMNRTKREYPEFYQWLTETEFPEVPSNF